jgi:hypothetical protein
MSERAWRNEGRMAGEASRIPIVRFTDEELWAEYRRIQRHLIAQGQPLFRKDVPEAGAKVLGLRMIEERNCDRCGVTFRPRTMRHRFCTPACLEANRQSAKEARGPLDRECLVCGTGFVLENSPNKKYCTTACRNMAEREKRKAAA